jgi:hypothetical protein
VNFGVVYKLYPFIETSVGLERGNTLLLLISIRSTFSSISMPRSNESEMMRRVIDRKFFDVLRPSEKQIFYKLERREAEIFIGKRAWRKILTAQKPGAPSATQSERDAADTVTAE